MTRGLQKWLLQVGSVSLAVVALLTSPLFAYEPPVEGETCAQACDRWGRNGFPVCANAANPAQCNRDRVAECKLNCTNQTCPTTFGCDTATNAPGGPTGAGCLPYQGVNSNHPACEVGCWSNGACSFCSCNPVGGDPLNFTRCSCTQAIAQSL